MYLERGVLPGIGVRHTATTGRRQRLGVICHLGGRRDLVLYDSDDASSAVATLVLDAAEAQQVAGLLNTVVTVDHLNELERELPGIAAVRLRLPAGSAFAGRPMRDAQARTRAAVTIAAVVHEGRVHLPPEPDLVLEPGDELLVIGTSEAIAALAAILGDSQTAA